jgi:hypothetical protein
VVFSRKFSNAVKTNARVLTANARARVVGWKLRAEWLSGAPWWRVFENPAKAERKCDVLPLNDGFLRHRHEHRRDQCERRCIVPRPGSVERNRTFVTLIAGIVMRLRVP